jgi:hypothetical protein
MVVAPSFNIVDAQSHLYHKLNKKNTAIFLHFGRFFPVVPGAYFSLAFGGGLDGVLDFSVIFFDSFCRSAFHCSPIHAFTPAIV